MIELLNGDATRIPLASGSVNLWYNDPVTRAEYRAFCVFAVSIHNRDCEQNAPYYRANASAVRVTTTAGNTERFDMSDVKRNQQGQFVKGQRSHPATEFKKGEHWRPEKPYWNREWLYNEYYIKGRTGAEIGKEWGISNEAILYWLKKHDIPARETSETRKLKRWGAEGKSNPMFGKRGALASSWKGGVTPERQACYNSQAWRKASRKVWKRDKGVCHRCEVSGVKVHLHHVISFAIEKYRADPDNLITLCEPCHRWVHSRENTHKEFIKEVEDDRAN